MKLLSMSKIVPRLILKRFTHSNSLIETSEEVRYALLNNKPVIALESTIITHGMPYPDNLNCAIDVENIIRQKV